MNTIFTAIIELIHTMITIYIWIIIIAALMSFVRPDPYNQFVQAIHKLTQPAFDLVRKNLPFVVISGIDLSPLVILLALQFVDRLLLGMLY